MRLLINWYSSRRNILKCTQRLAGNGYENRMAELDLNYCNFSLQFAWQNPINCDWFSDLRMYSEIRCTSFILRIMRSPDKIIVIFMVKRATAATSLGQLLIILQRKSVRDKNLRPNGAQSLRYRQPSNRVWQQHTNDKPNEKSKDHQLKKKLAKKNTPRENRILKIKLASAQYHVQ